MIYYFSLTTNSSQVYFVFLKLTDLPSFSSQSFSKKHDIELNTISGGWKTNLKVRQEKDWEEKEGRSVSFKKTK